MQSETALVGTPERASADPTALRRPPFALRSSGRVSRRPGGVAPPARPRRPAPVAAATPPDPSPASTGEAMVTRYCAFAGSIVSVRSSDGRLALMLVGEQGSVNVAAHVAVQAKGPQRRRRWPTLWNC